MQESESLVFSRQLPKSSCIRTLGLVCNGTFTRVSQQHSGMIGLTGQALLKTHDHNKSALASCSFIKQARQLVPEHHSQVTIVKWIWLCRHIKRHYRRACCFALISASKLKARHACFLLKYHGSSICCVISTAQHAHGIPGKLIMASVIHAVAFCMSQDICGLSRGSKSRFGMQSKQAHSDPQAPAC